MERRFLQPDLLSGASHPLYLLQDLVLFPNSPNELYKFAFSIERESRKRQDLQLSRNLKILIDVHSQNPHLITAFFLHLLQFSHQDLTMAAARLPELHQDRNRTGLDHSIKLSIGHSLKNGTHDDVANRGWRIWATMWANN